MAAPAAVVTGLGLVSPHGQDARAMFEAVMQGRSAVRPVLPEHPKPVVAATCEFNAADWFTLLQLNGVDRVSQLAVAAAGLALQDAGLGLPQDTTRVGVYVGCGMGGAAAMEAAYASGARSGRVSPLTVPAFMPNAPAAHVAMRHGLRGPVLTYSVACASSAVALAEAAKAVRAGEVDLALAGGAEALVVSGVVLAWQALMTLAPPQPGREAEACRPFDARRNGFVLGEGAAFLVLEAEHHARARGAQALAVLAGSATNCDASHLTKPDAAGQAAALRGALRQAGLGPADVGYCNAHGTATKAGDVVEAQALREAFGAAADGLRVSSTKALHGHLLGATGALEAAITVLALHGQRLPPNAHCEQPDPQCPLNLVLRPNDAAPGLRAALSSSFAFGGTNCVLAFTRP